MSGARPPRCGRYASPAAAAMNPGRFHAVVTSKACRGGVWRLPKIGLHRAAVIGPLQQGLPLPGPAEAIARVAIRPDLRGMTAEGVPAPDLSPVLVRHAAAHMVAAVPLEPATR